MATRELQIETEIIAKLLRESKDGGWQVTTSITDVPEEIGHYALQDGLSGKGCGVTHNMRKSIKECHWFKTMKRPIFMWLPDNDGSAALWLDHKTRCSECSLILDFFTEEAHYKEVHGIDISPDECECER